MDLESAAFQLVVGADDLRLHAVEWDGTVLEAAPWCAVVPTLRLANANDADAIHRLLVSAFSAYRDEYTTGCFDATVLDAKRIRARMAEGPMWAVVLDGKLVGTMSAVPDERGVYVRGMAVHPAARRRGIGNQLLRAGETYAQENNAAMWLSTTLFLTESITLYQSFGFVDAEGPHSLHGTALRSFEKPAMPPS